MTFDNTYDYENYLASEYPLAVNIPVSNDSLKKILEQFGHWNRRPLIFNNPRAQTFYWAADRWIFRNGCYHFKILEDALLAKMMFA